MNDLSPGSARCVRSLFRLASLFIVVAGLVLGHAGAAVATPTTREVTTLADSGAGSLRAAIAASAAGDVVRFSPALFAGALPRTIVLTSGELVISRPLTIVGPGDSPAGVPMLTVSGAGKCRVLRIACGTATPGVEISGLTISSGRAVDGGGILLENGMLTMDDCDIVGNVATHHGGGIYAGTGSTLILDGCLVERNTAADDGGGIALYRSTLVGRRVLIAANQATDQGGGIYNAHGKASLENSTISGNTAERTAAIFTNGDNSKPSETSLRACTVAFNDANSETGGIHVLGKSTWLRLAGTILSNNVLTPSGKPTVASDLLKAYDGTVSSNNYNLIRAPRTGSITPAANDRIGSGFDPRLAPLALNGGRTRTHALQAGSHALDYIPAGFHPASLATDQRGEGFPRYAGSVPALADIGACEAQPPRITVEALDIVVECAGASTPVQIAFRVVDADGAVSSIAIRDTQGIPFWTATPAEIATASSGGTIVAPISVGHAAHDTMEFRILASDGSQVGSASVFVTLVDTTPPVVTRNGPELILHEGGTAYADLGATAVDVCQGILQPTLDLGAFVSNQTGLYTLVYSATDHAGNTGTATRRVQVVDTTAPTLSVSPASLAWEATDPAQCGFSADASAFLDVEITASDACDATPTISLGLAKPGGGFEALAFPRVFPVGTTTVYAIARDDSGNQSSSPITVTVADKAAPVITVDGVVSGTVPLGGALILPDASALDNCDGGVAVTRSVNGVPGALVDTCRLGRNVVVYAAVDSAGNESTVTRTIEVVAPAVDFVVDEQVVLTVDPGNCAARRHVVSSLASPEASLAEIVGLPAACGTVRIAAGIVVPGSATVQAPDADGTFNFPAGTSTVTVDVFAQNVGVGEAKIATRTFAVQVVEDDFQSCAANLVWKLAIDLSGPDLAGGKPVSQYLSRPGEARWFKIKVSPGSRIHVILAGLPADYDVAVYRDIAKTLAQLNGTLQSGDPALALLGVEFAAENYAAENYAAENYAAENYAAENYAAENYAAENYAAENYAAENYAAENYAAENYAAENYADANFSAENYAALFAAAENYAAENYAAENYAAENYAAENYAAAQQASLMVFSSLPGTISDEIRFNTFAEGGEFYIRVRGKNGAYSAIEGDVFTLFVQVTEDVCKDVDNLTTALTPAEISALQSAVGADKTSLILWNKSRITGTATERDALQARLAELATATNGAVVDVGAIGTIAALDAQADANTACPAAKNLVAEAIRNAIIAVRSVAPIQDITLVGNDDVIPFFRIADEGQLASEANYYPPVKGDSHSQSSLRNANVLTQDRYGSTCQVFLTTGPYDLPEIPVGRLVETARQVTDYIAAYLPVLGGATPGVLPLPAQPAVFISGYDFLSDAATAVEGMLAAGLSGVPGGPIINDTLIADPLGAPSQLWTATQFESQFLSRRYDLAFLAGHFSTAGLLAADYKTRFSAARMLQAPFAMTHSVVFSIGCHSGYNTVNEHAVPLVTEQPDWAEAFAIKRAIWISGTAYQYGDTDTVEFGERLYLELARALGAGTGPVAIGQALVEAKRRYLEETPVMRGIHEKTLAQVTLYGLPMLKLDLPGAAPAPAVPVRGASPSVAVGEDTPGDGFGLRVGALQFIGPAPAERIEQVKSVDTGELLAFSYLQGSGDGTLSPAALAADPYAGTVVLTGEPVRPLEVFNLSQPGFYARGVGFRGGSFRDLPGRRPSTGAAATEISGVKFKFTTDVLYPIRPWNLNHTGTFCGSEAASRLNLFPGQFISDFAPDGSAEDTGTIRRFDAMHFDVFYSPEIPDVDPDTLSPEAKARLQAQFTLAQANAPTVNVLTTQLNAEGKPAFAVEVAALRAVGVQNVWVTYSILRPDGSGEWRSLDLAPPDEARGIGLWTGVLDDPDADKTIGGTLRYFVQAVNGIGAVSLNTNLGRFFRIGTSTLDEAGTGAVGAVDTQLALVGAVPAGGVYRDPVQLQARLTSAGVPVPGKSVAFRVGPLVATGITDTDGIAVAEIVLGVEPGVYQVEAAFAGDGAHNRSSSAGSAFAVTKRPTVLTFASVGTVLDSSLIAARLDATFAGGDPTPLKEKTVLFVITPTTPAGAPFALAAITDGAGIARLEAGAVQPGAYQIVAYFADSVAVNGVAVELIDQLYLPAQASGAFVVAPPRPFELQLGKEAIKVTYGDSTAAGSSWSNRGHSRTEIAGLLRFADPARTPVDVLAAPDARSVRMQIRATLSGKVLFDGPVALEASCLSDRIWKGRARVAGSEAELNLLWLPNNTGILYVAMTTPKGSGPLYRATPAILTCELTFGTGDGEKAAKLDLTVGDATRPWTKQQTNLRTRIAP